MRFLYPSFFSETPLCGFALALAAFWHSRCARCTSKLFKSEVALQWRHRGGQLRNRCVVKKSPARNFAPHQNVKKLMKTPGTVRVAREASWSMAAPIQAKSFAKSFSRLAGRYKLNDQRKTWARWQSWVHICSSTCATTYTHLGAHPPGKNTYINHTLIRTSTHTRVYKSRNVDQSM